MKRLLLPLCLGVNLIAASLPTATAFNVFPYPLEVGTGYAKWGDPNAGTPGGVVTWSLMPTGTTLDVAAPDYIHGTSNLAAVFNQVGGEAAALTLIQSAFDHWSQVANIQFLYRGVDDGTPFNAPYGAGQALGDIRIGGFEIDGFSAGLGFTAPPNGGTTLEGDIILNNRADISFYAASGAEGQLYDLFPPGGGFYRNDFEGLIVHELGHALGLAHSNVPSGCMCGYVDPDFDGSECAYYDPDGDGRVPINRIPEVDDVAGAQFLYGPPITADFDADADVDGDDFLTWQRGLGTTGGATRTTGDANSDANIDALDLTVWQTQFAAASAATAAAPEPTGCVLSLSLVIGAAGGWGKAKRRPSYDGIWGVAPATPIAI